MGASSEREKFQFQVNYPFNYSGCFPTSKAAAVPLLFALGTIYCTAEEEEKLLSAFKRFALENPLDILHPG